MRTDKKAFPPEGERLDKSGELDFDDAAGPAVLMSKVAAGFPADAAVHEFQDNAVHRPQAHAEEIGQLRRNKMSFPLFL
jgi:hypothetical protein